MKQIFNTVFLLLVCVATYSQNNVSGTFPSLSNQYVRLVGFDGFTTYTIDSVMVDEKGSFSLSFGKNNYGMGYLATKDNKAFIVILAPNEDLWLEGEALEFPQTIKIIRGKQNQIFEQYANEHPRRENALSAWDYLARLYRHDSLFAYHLPQQNIIEAEIRRIKQEDDAFLASLNPETYLSWYLPVRKLVSMVPTIAQFRTREIPKTIASFRSMNYTDPRLYKSGLLSEIIEAHVWLIENSGSTLDSVFIELNISIDHMLDNLLRDEEKFNRITDYLFKLLEKRSLFASSEYLALKVLNETRCNIHSELSAQLESYRSMKIGNTAPDFTFEEVVFAPDYEKEAFPQKLSDLRSKFTVVIFGASWCSACSQELSDIALLYQKWKKYGVEVVFVSLDEDKQTFKSFAGGFPFISICDYQKWESPIVKNYHVFATPTIYLLDINRKVLLRPNSASHMDSWVDWFLVQGRQ
jgi:thiol-disulfide isomerase/thioredoxin